MTAETIAFCDHSNILWDNYNCSNFKGKILAVRTDRKITQRMSCDWLRTALLTFCDQSDANERPYSCMIKLFLVTVINLY